MEQNLLQELVRDIKAIRAEVGEIKTTLNEIDQDLHREPKPEYERILDETLKHGKFKNFSSIEELKKDIESD